MIDLRRLRGPLMTSSFVAGVLGLSSLILSSTIGRDPRAYLGNDWSTFTFVSYQQVGPRISGVLREGGAAHGRLGALLGASTLEWGVDPATLNSGTEMPWRWLSLPGKGSTAVDLLGMGRVLLRSGLAPEVLVLALNPGMLARPGTLMSDPDSEDVSFDLSAVARHVAERRWGLLVSDGRELLVGLTDRLLPARTRVNNRLQYALFRGRLGLSERWNLPVRATFVPSPAPWDTETGFMKTPHVSEDGLRTQMAGLMARSWFDPNAYSTEGEETRAIVRLIREARARGIRVVVVLVPESTRLREAVPPEAGRCLDGALRDAFGEEPPAVVDLRDSLPDELFHDASHLDLDGRRAFTRRLSAELEARLLRTGAVPRR